MTRLVGTLLLIAFSSWLIPAGAYALAELLDLVGWWRTKRAKIGRHDGR